jgi:hypothetical protein
MAERPTSLTGAGPTIGSCLIYGDSGLPNRGGPLAPDKLVFRDGWSEDSTYLLLNLRFTGWHRYKGTNALTLLYQSGPLVVEELDGAPFSWLPVGRAAYRDKRIPRENLNGLVVERSGFDAVVYHLTGAGGPWAQDPPHHAQVERFTPGAEMDYASVLMEGWRGWSHRREVYFLHDAPTIIVDKAHGPSDQLAAISWHVKGLGALENGRARIGGSETEAEMVVLAPGPHLEVQESNRGEGNLTQLLVTSADAHSSPLEAVTVFLYRDWVGATVELVGSGDSLSVLVDKGERRLQVPLLPPRE